jgi:AraC-like DNA-binding protein
VRDGAVEGDLVVRDLGRIEDRLRAAPDFQTRACWIERELLARLMRTGDMAVALRMRKLAVALPVTSRAWSSDVSRLLGYSRSHAHRLFAEWLGQPTSELVRLTRFVLALRALHDVQSPLTAVGHRLGYFDQAHFIRNFRDFAGMSPGEYRRRRGEMPGQLEL